MSYCCLPGKRLSTLLKGSALLPSLLTHWLSQVLPLVEAYFVLSSARADHMPQPDHILRAASSELGRTSSQGIPASTPIQAATPIQAVIPSTPLATPPPPSDPGSSRQSAPPSSGQAHEHRKALDAHMPFLRYTLPPFSLLALKDLNLPIVFTGFEKVLENASAQDSAEDLPNSLAAILQLSLRIECVLLIVDAYPSCIKLSQLEQFLCKYGSPVVVR